MEQNQATHTVPTPTRATNPDELPDALTIFLTRAQRADAVRALKRIDRDRSCALLRALGVEQRQATTGERRSETNKHAG